MKYKMDYRKFYEDLQREVINLLVDDKESGMLMKELIDKVLKEQEVETNYDL